MTRPELLITIRRVGAAERHEYEATLTRADNKAEICVNTFIFEPNLLIDIEPVWMLMRAVPRKIDDALRNEQEAVDYEAKETQLLVEYGQRLYGFLFGDGKELQSFLKYNDAYAKSAHLTLALHSNAAVLWRLPWEYLHDGRDFLALHGKFQLSRRPYELGQLEREPVQLPLRLLVIVSSPDDQVELNTEKEIGAIQEALDEAERSGLIQTAYLEDATLEAIGDALKTFNPHVFHYTGHGVFRADMSKPENSRSYLALEKEDGQTRLAGIQELRPHLQGAAVLRLAVLSGCQTAQTSDTDAFSGVATGMLAAEIPAVVAMQFSILDSSAIHLARAFYTALARGESLAAAMQATRIALWQFEEGPGYDWGVPALYVRTQEMVLVDSEQNLRGLQGLGGLTGGNTLINVDGLPLPRHFVGRKGELRQLRRALRDNQMKSAFIRGIGGMGKSSLAAKLAQRPGTELDGILVIRCHEVDALDIPGKLAGFLQSQGVAGHAEASNLLLDSRLDPTERAQRAAQLVAGRRYLLVFDNFESVMEEAGEQRGGGVVENVVAFEVADETLRGLLKGLLRANWRSLCLFTGRYRWRGYKAQVAQDTGVEIHLPELTLPQTMMLMNKLSRLRLEPRQAKIAMYHKVGGHPKTIELLNGWLKAGRVSDLLAHRQLDGLLTQQWEEYFLGRLLAQLSDDERVSLTRLSIFQTRLGDEELSYAGVGEGLVQRWLDLSLLQRERGGDTVAAQLAELLPMPPLAEQEKVVAQRQAPDSYTVHLVVADYLLRQVSPEERKSLHHWAAVFYGQPFVQIARDYASRTGQTWTEEKIEEVARDKDGVVGQIVARTDDMDEARVALARALAWQEHLFVAGEVKAAGQVVVAVYLILDRWGERDRAKGLLRRSIYSLEGFHRAVVRGNLANILQNEGKLAEALAIHQELYETFAAIDAKQQMGASLSQIGTIYRLQGEINKAIEKQKESLKIKQEIKREDEQAISLHELATLHRMNKEYRAALDRNREAEVLARKVSNEALIAMTLHEQGLIYNEIAQTGVSDEKRRKYNRKAVACFQDSLTIERDIGNEAGAADTLGELGKMLLSEGQINEAISAFAEVLATSRKLGDSGKVAATVGMLGVIHEQQGQYEAALTKYLEALTLQQQHGLLQDASITQKQIARIQIKLGRNEGTIKEKCKAPKKGHSPKSNF